MKPNEILLFYGTRYKFQQQTGISARSLANWLKSGYVPYAQQCRLEKLTEDRLKASLDDLKIKKEPVIKFTLKQIDFIRHQISQWYLITNDFKSSSAREELKMMIFGKEIKDE